MMTNYVIMRTIVDLPDDQVTVLDKICQQKKISRAEAVRRAVSSLLDSEKQTSREAAFGAWSNRGDARSQVDFLRDEWER